MAVDIERDGQIAVLTMNRPDALNAFDSEQLRAMLSAVTDVASDSRLRAVVLTGAGKSFAAGADIKEMAGMTPREALAFGQMGHAVGAAIAAAPQPWIAAVNGFALGGGCEMALACDIRLAAENAVFGQPEVGLGIPPGWGGTQRLPRLVGPGLASEMIFTGRRVRAEEALRIGLVSAVYPADELLEKARDMARAIAANAPLAIAACKRAIAAGLDADISTGLAFEAQVFALSFGTADQGEGMTAFTEKRKAEFRGQ
jgi:enoyl-CoA hydratase